MCFWLRTSSACTQTRAANIQQTPPFIIITTFAVVNLLVGLIVNSMQDAHHEEDNEKALAHRDEVIKRLIAIEKKLHAQDQKNSSKSD